MRRSAVFASILGAALLAGSLPVLTAAPAAADGWKREWDGKHGWPRYKHHLAPGHYRHGYWYAPPRVIVVPPPRYYYYGFAPPPPVYYYPPPYRRSGLSLFLDLD